MRKKSFFEKLTGIVKVDDSDNDLEIERQEVRAKNKLEETEIETEGQLAIDMYQTPSEIIIKTMVAGVKLEDLDISIGRDMVIIKGRRERFDTIEDEDYFYSELYWGLFSKTVMLPQEINVDEAEATNKNGLLTIRMPKLDKNKQFKLRVKNI
ncbi:MAG: Hsp20/alpha crystallin family protein [bacterium]